MSTSSDTNSDSERSFEDPQESMPDPTPAATVQIGNETYELVNDPSNQKVSTAVLFSKKNRKNMSEEKKVEHFKHATSFQQTDRFAFMSRTIEGSDDLGDNYNLQMCVEQACNNMSRYDMVDVFTIVTPDGKKVIGNLFTGYAVITVDQVKESNYFYRMVVDQTKYPWLLENLQLSLDYLINNSETDVYRKILETYNRSEPEYQGGPLFFILLMQQLQSNGIAVVKAFQESLKKVSITKYDGEDISRVVSDIRGVLKRLRGLEKTDAQGNVLERKVPEDLSETLLQVFQTSSDATFNDVFKSMRNASLIRSTEFGYAAYGSPEKILDTAENLYLQLSSSVEGWAGVHTKGNESVFTNAVSLPQKEKPCFNCGRSGHDFNTCPEPKNEAKIQANRTKYLTSKNTGRGTGGRNSNRGGRGRGRGRGRSSGRGGSGRGDKPDYSLPKDGENGRRTIKGVPHYYHYKTKRWLKVDKPDASANPAVVAPNPLQPGNTIGPVIQQPGTSAHAAQAIALATANMQAQMQQTLEGFATAIRESL